MMKSFIKIFSFIFLSIACFQADAQITVSTANEQPFFYAKDSEKIDFLVRPTWLIGDNETRDSLLFFLTSEGDVGVYQKKDGHHFAQQCADAYEVAKTELSCVSGKVYTITVSPYNLMFVSFDDGQNTLRIADLATNETVAIYCDACH